jgi:hypothetical protein
MPFGRFLSGNSKWSQYWMPNLVLWGIQYWDHFELPGEKLLKDII